MNSQFLIKIIDIKNLIYNYFLIKKKTTTLNQKKIWINREKKLKYMKIMKKKMSIFITSK